MKKLQPSEKYRDIIIIIGLIIFGILLSIFCKNEQKYDFANYHYYNAWAFLNNRLNVNIVPAALNTFFNPLIELPLYFYIQLFNNYPNIIWGLQGLWFSLLLCMLYKITSLFIDISDKKNIPYLISLLLIASSGQATMLQIGASTNEIMVAALDLIGIYFIIKMLKYPQTQKIKNFIIAGLIMGMTLGLKQTSIVNCISTGITLILCWKMLKSPIKSISSFAICGIIGYLIINGYFMWEYWINYKNPFFPFLNGLFHSPYFDDFNYRDTSFLEDPLKFYLYPYMWHFEEDVLCAAFYQDYRLDVYYSLLIIYGFYTLFNYKNKSFITKNKLLIILSLFLIINYFLWMFTFAILRYAVVFEVLGALFIILLLHKYKNKYLSFSILIVSIVIFITHLCNYIDLRIRDEITKYVDVEEINLPNNSIIKMYGQISSIIIPDIVGEKNIRVLTYYIEGDTEPNGIGSDFAERGKFREIRDTIVKEHKGPITIIYTERFATQSKIDEYEKNKDKNIQMCEQAQKLKFLSPRKNCRNYIEESKATLLPENLDNYFCKTLQNNVLLGDTIICIPSEIKEQVFKGE